MIPGGPLYVFSIGMGYTGEKLAKNLDRKLQKLKENDRFFMNGALRGAFGASTGAFKLKDALVLIMQSDLGLDLMFELF